MGVVKTRNRARRAAVATYSAAGMARERFSVFVRAGCRLWTDGVRKRTAARWKFRFGLSGSRCRLQSAADNGRAPASPGGLSGSRSFRADWQRSMRLPRVPDAVYGCDIDRCLCAAVVSIRVIVIGELLKGRTAGGWRPATNTVYVARNRARPAAQPSAFRGFL